MDDMWNGGPSWQSTGWALDNCVSKQHQALLTCWTGENGIWNVFKWSFKFSLSLSIIPKSRFILSFRRRRETEMPRNYVKIDSKRPRVKQNRLKDNNCINRERIPICACLPYGERARSMPPRSNSLYILCIRYEKKKTYVIYIQNVIAIHTGYDSTSPNGMPMKRRLPNDLPAKML